jgi:hypothetical protein
LETSSDKGKKTIKTQIFAFLSKKIKFFPEIVILKNRNLKIKFFHTQKRIQDYQIEKGINRRLPCLWEREILPLLFIQTHIPDNLIFLKL